MYDIPKFVYTLPPPSKKIVIAPACMVMSGDEVVPRGLFLVKLFFYTNKYSNIFLGTFCTTYKTHSKFCIISKLCLYRSHNWEFTELVVKGYDKFMREAKGCVKKPLLLYFLFWG